MVREEGFGGAFIFEVDYDAAGANNLVSWLGKGLRGETQLTRFILLMPEPPPFGLLCANPVPSQRAWC